MNMDDSSRGPTHEELRQVSTKVSGPLERLLATVPWIRRLISFLVPGGKAYGPIGESSRLLELGQFEDAFQVALHHAKELHSSRPSLPAEVSYWMLIENLARAGQELEGKERWKLVETVIREPPVEASGNAAARALEMLSRGFHRYGEICAAYKYADASMDADPTWHRSIIWATWLRLATQAADAEDFVRSLLGRHPELASEFRSNASLADFELVQRVVRDVGQ